MNGTRTRPDASIPWERLELVPVRSLLKEGFVGYAHQTTNVVATDSSRLPPPNRVTFDEIVDALHPKREGMGEFGGNNFQRGEHL